MKLELTGRPFVAFDASNKQHRRYYAEFVKHNTWGKCPVRFVVPDDFGDLVTMIQRQLVAWYVANEFKERKPARKKARKRNPITKSGIEKNS